jgi:hypothetical protein
MTDDMNFTKSKFARRAELGEKNASTPVDEASGSINFFNVRRPRLEYPHELEKPHRPQDYAWADQYSHLGRIGYTSNSYQFRGPNKDDNNIYGRQHMKKTCWLEEMRRRCIAEEHGITAEVDESSIAGTADAYNVVSREKRNKYIKKTDIVGLAWTTTPSLKSTSSTKTKT